MRGQVVQVSRAGAYHTLPRLAAKDALPGDLYPRSCALAARTILSMTGGVILRPHLTACRQEAGSISTAARFHMSVVGAVSLMVTVMPAAGVATA